VQKEKRSPTKTELLQQFMILITQEELLHIFEHWPKNKAPGPNGYTEDYFQKIQNLATS
jgi:hypothetical protein